MQTTDWMEKIFVNIKMPFMRAVVHFTLYLSPAEATRNVVLR